MTTYTSRRDFLVKTAIGASTALAVPNLLLGQKSRNRDPRPNILFFQSDDAAWQALGPFSPYVQWTPNFNRLAREGLTFNRCYCENALCSPARAAMLTGKMSHLNGVYDNFTVFDGRQQTFPKLLRSAGYQTAMVGKWHLHSYPTGFDYYNVLDGQGLYYDCPFIEHEKRIIRPGFVDHVSREIGLDWLKRRDPGKPFLLIQSFKSCHRTWDPPPEHLRSLEDFSFPEPATLYDDFCGRGQALHGQEERIYDNLDERDLKLLPDGPSGADQTAWQVAYARRRKDWEAAKNLRGPDLLRWKHRMHMLDYARMIATLDDQIGHFLRYLDEADLAKSTLVIFSSDHGLFVGEHGMFDKRFMYEQAFRIPCLVRWPGVVQPGSRCDELCQNIDYAPTLLEAAGQSVPGDIQGRSLLPILRGERPAAWRKSLYYHYYEYSSPHRVFPHEGIAMRDQKLINFYLQHETEFYDLAGDPHERTNGAGDPAYTSAVAELTAELTRMRSYYCLPSRPPVRWVGRKMDMIEINQELPK